jgi:NADPH:quinone reductase-like Zn-dependent oxidoreductase
LVTFIDRLRGLDSKDCECHLKYNHDGRNHKTGAADESKEEVPMRAIHLTAFGNPAQGLEFVQIQEPAAPGPGQALIGVEFSPIDLSDLLVVSGAYPFRPSLPSVIGNEGVGRILALGPGVDNVAVGDRVLTPLYGLSWAERIVVPAEGLFALPTNVDPQQLAMLTINPPTAGLLLSEFVDLAAGDWVVQNAANSGVGRAVIAFAKARGFKTINLVRRTELIDELKALGGDLVIVDAPEGLNLAKDTLGAAAPRLAIDGVGGPSAATLINRDQRPGADLQTNHGARVLPERSGARGQDCAARRRGSRIAPIRSAACPCGRDLSLIGHQGGRGPCATRRQGAARCGRQLSAFARETRSRPSDDATMRQPPNSFRPGD